jgi:hypothetical protein
VIHEIEERVLADAGDAGRDVDGIHGCAAVGVASDHISGGSRIRASRIGTGDCEQSKEYDIAPKINPLNSCDFFTLIILTIFAGPVSPSDTKKQSNRRPTLSGFLVLYSR